MCAGMQVQYVYISSTILVHSLVHTVVAEFDHYHNRHLQLIAELRTSKVYWSHN